MWDEWDVMGGIDMVLIIIVVEGLEASILYSYEADCW